MPYTAELEINAYHDGKAAGSWVFDGNTEIEQYAAVLKGFEDGDPEIMDYCTSPLSGEWADSPTPQSIQSEYEIPDEELDEACSMFEDAFQRGFWDEVISAAKIQLTPA